MTEDEKIELIYEKLLECHLRARKGKRRTANEHRFEINLFQNLYQMALDVVSYKYEPSPGIAFIVQSPVRREIFAAPYRDRIIHHFIYMQVEDYWERRFIHYSCSCRKKKGTLFAVRSVEKFVRKATANYAEEAVVFKYDLTGYFMSLPRKKLYSKAITGLRRQFKGRENNILFPILKYLWRKTIMNDPTIGIKIRGSISDWEKLPRRKSLFFQPKNQGVVIGNLTSQLLSNIYLNDFDHYMQEAHIGCYYVRYVDDFMLICNQKYCERVKRLVCEMEVRLLRENLRINQSKSYCQNVRRGIAFVGVVIYPWRTVIGRRLKRNMGLAERRFMAGSVQVDTVVSYIGFLKHYCSCYLAESFIWKCLCQDTFY